MPFLMIRNDITKVAADAIVNPANRNLLQGSGTSRAIYQAAGEQELTAACEAIGYCEPGRAVCTSAFGLPAKYIFHAVCPAWHGGVAGEAEQLASVYHSALEPAAEYHCESVAFPLLSSGNYGYPKEQAFRIAVDTITQYVMDHDLTVYLVLYDRHSLAVSRKLFASVEEYIDDHYVAQNDESYEFDRNNYKHKDFPLLSENSHFTDDTVMTLAVALGLIAGQGDAQKTFAGVQHEMRHWGRRYPHAGYGGMFRQWLRAEHPQPYGSFGNGSAMRVAAAGWLFDTLDKTLEMAKVTAEVTHNHPEGIKGAQATAAAIFLARTGHSKPEIKRYVEQTFGYDLSRTCDEIRPGYRHVETCQQTVPEAIIAFLESTGFEDALRNAVSLGGDSDTLACITGGIAEAFYGMPPELREETLKRLPEEMQAAYELFRQSLERKM
jgi:ADP-ribosylglycohydrolase/O-acetyl-ADP-ribose deacetylase (regulator of RNase III)